MVWEPGDNPFPGFRPFYEEESHLFFGRDEATYDLVDRLAESSFLAVLGGSGSGKSSLVKCGLLPALHRGLLGAAGASWHVATMRPRTDPLGRLAKSLADARLMRGKNDEDAIEARLRRDTLGLVDLVAESRLEPHENLLVFVDQFEELFRYRDAIREDGRTEDDIRFVKLLLEAAARTKSSMEDAERRTPGPRVFVLITMRSDFLAECSGFQGLAERINEGFFLVPFPTREERREAIEGPLAVAGEEMTPRLVHRFLNDTGEDPSRLPVLQHALMRTWDAWRERTAGVRRDGGFVTPKSKPPEERRKLDLCDYEKAGGVDSALNNHLEHVLQGLSDNEVKAAEGAFRQLTETLRDGRAVRRPAEFKAIQAATGSSPNDLLAVFRAFRDSSRGRTFIVPTEEEAIEPETLIDISHESLILQWEQLQAWMKVEASRTRVYQDLSDRAEKFHHPTDEFGNELSVGRWSRRRGSKLKNPELQQALNWREELGTRAALWAKPHDRRNDRTNRGFKEAEDYLFASRRARTSTRIFWAALVATVFAVTGAFAENRRRAAALESRARVIELARSNVTEDPLAGALTLASLQGQPDVRNRGQTAGIRLAETPLPTAHSSLPGAVTWFDPDVERGYALVFTDPPSGERIPVLASLTEGGGIQLVPGLGDNERSRLLAGAIEGTGGVLVFEAPYDVAATTTTVPGEGGAPPQQTPPLRDIASGWVSLEIPPEGTFHRLSPLRTHLLAVYDDAVCVWAIAGVPDGTRLACGADSRLEHADVLRAEFSDQGEHVVGWGQRGSRVWEVSSGDPIWNIGPVTRGGDNRDTVDIRTAHYDAIANRLVVGDDLGARFWVSPDAPVCELPHETGVDHVIQHGDRLWTFSNSTTARAWQFSTMCTDNAAAGPDAMIVVADGGSSITSVSTSVDGGLFATVADDGIVKVWCAEANSTDPRCLQLGRERLTLRGHSSSQTTARFIGEGAGTTLVTADATGGVRRWGIDGTEWHESLAVTEPARMLEMAVEDHFTGGLVAVYGTFLEFDEAGDPAEPDRSQFPEAQRIIGHIGDNAPSDFAWTGNVFSLAVSPDGQYLVVGGMGSAVVLNRAGDQLHEISHDGAVLALGFLGHRELMSVGQGDIQVTDVREGNGTRSATVLPDRARAAEVLSDGSVLIATARAGRGPSELQYWDGQAFETIASVEGQLVQVAGSPSGNRVSAASTASRLSASRDGESGAWSVKPEVSDSVLSLHFLSDSLLLVSARGKGVRALEADTDEAAFAFHTALNGTVVAVDPGAGRVVTRTDVAIGADAMISEVRSWPIGWSGLVSRLREVAQGCLSPGLQDLLANPSTMTQPTACP